MKNVHLRSNGAIFIITYHNKQTNKQFIITLTYVVGSTTKNHNSLVFKVQIMLLVKQTNQR